MLKLIAPALVSVLLLCSCDTQVKQQKPPRIPGTEEKSNFDTNEGDDIQPEPDEGAPVPVEEKKLTKAERKQKCCAHCQKALENDRSGDKPEKIPCADFTADLSNSCRKFFVDNPVMASDAKACAGDYVVKDEKPKEDKSAATKILEESKGQ